MPVITLAAAKQYMRWPAADTTNDAQLVAFIDAATVQCEYWFGALAPRDVLDEVHDGGTDTILLRVTPVVSVTTLVEYVGMSPYVLTLQPPGSTVNNYGYSLDDPVAGLVVRRSGAGTPMPFLGGSRGVVASYRAGQGVVPDDIQLAAMEDVRGLWQQTQQGGRPSFSGNAEEDGWSVGPMRLFPRLAAIAASSMRTPSIA